MKQSVHTLIMKSAVLLVLPLLWYCTPSGGGVPPKAVKPKSSQLAGGAGGTAVGTATATSSSPVARPKVSAFELDDSKFLIRRISVGLETYLNSQTPVLNYDLPDDADYAEITRCPSTAVIAGATDSIKLEDIELSTATTADRDRLYRNNNFWDASNTAGCAQLTQGTIAKNFYDSWAPSGSYRYLIRACVGQERMTDTTNMTTRNCTRQIAISQPLNDYQNNRDQTQQKYLQKATADSANILLILRTAVQQADEYACYIQWCECGSSSEDQSICQRDATTGAPAACKGGEYGREVAKKKKQAIVTLVAIGLDVVMTAATSELSVMSIVMGSAALSGMSFNTMFQALAVQTQDFPRACQKGISLDLQMSDIALKVEDAKSQYDFDICRAKAAGAQISAAAGVDPTADSSTSNCPTDPSLHTSGNTDTTASPGDGTGAGAAGSGNGSSNTSTNATTVPL